jgi:hypothetical protein
MAAMRSWSGMAMALPAHPHPPSGSAYWWGRLVDQDLYVGLIRDIEAVKGRQSIHEAECAQRYKVIENNTTEMKADIAAAVAGVNTLVARGQAAAWAVNWKAWAVAGTIGALLLSALVWTSSQLYELEPHRIAAANAKK